MKKLFIALVLMFAANACTPPTAAMIASTVQIHVRYKGASGESGGGDGSGFVYEKHRVHGGAVKSLIMSAEHVLGKIPKIGAVVDGITITDVIATAITEDGRSCELRVLARGDEMFGDVATAEANCDAGRVAVIAEDSPAVGDKLFISGHPDAWPMIVLTEGYFSGWLNDFMSMSAPAWPGNSGGPVFNARGQVVGILVRGDTDYHHITLAVGLEQIWNRVKATELLCR